MTGLEELYREIILDHYRSPRNRGELPSPPAHKVEGFNPLCGDEIVLYLVVADGVVVDLAVSGQGCSISQSSASLMSSAVKGRPVADARRLVASMRRLLTVNEEASGEEGDEEGLLTPEELGELAAMQGVVKFPVRIKCATLSWSTLERGLDEMEAGAPQP
jgi:nitrogen fixation NifU-like protein